MREGDGRSREGSVTRSRRCGPRPTRPEFTSCFSGFPTKDSRRAPFSSACDRTREAVVVDPRRDIDVIHGTRGAAGLDARRTRSKRTPTPTSCPGARELAALGAVIVAGPGAGSAVSVSRGVASAGAARRRHRARAPAHARTYARAHLDRRARAGRAGARPDRRHAVRWCGRAAGSAGRRSDASARRPAVRLAVRHTAGARRRRRGAPGPRRRLALRRRDRQGAAFDHRTGAPLQSAAAAALATPISSPQCSTICRTRPRTSRG